MMIAHPPCTYLSYVGLRWYKTQPERMYKTKVDWSTKGKHVSIAGSKSHARSKTFDGIANAMAAQWTVQYA
jgi:hypothetical protein